MVVFPKLPSEPIDYDCPVCHRRYRIYPTSGAVAGCAVLHSPGSCCHVGEVELDSQPAREAEVGE